jgi:leucyl/phenylalanyl-tRNA---protein transferase
MQSLTDTSAAAISAGRREDRRARFAETPRQWLERQVLGLAYTLKPVRIGEALPLALASVADFLTSAPAAPQIGRVNDRPPGYGGRVRDESPEVVLDGMRAGFYPHSHIGPLKWWSPPKRAIMSLSDVHIAKRFRRTLRGTDLTVSFGRAFDDVLLGCAARRPGRPHLTWLRPGTLHLYSRLFDKGHAHSVEVWNAEGALVGGLFGVALGPVFGAMSMFHIADNASKIGIVSLYHHLSEWGFTTVDHQNMSAWVETLGGQVVPRADYVSMLSGPAPAKSAPGRWQAEFTPQQTADWTPPGATTQD